MPGATEPLIDFFEVTYETAADVPPPHCYYYQLRGTITGGQLRVDFQWVYHHRESLTLEEIEDEGFTENDGFSWEGTVHPVWINLVTQQLKRTRGTATAGGQASFLEITAKRGNHVIYAGTPPNLEVWEYVLQEFIQAILEASGKEAPLQIQFRRIFPDRTFRHVTLQLPFNPHVASVQIRSGRGTTTNASVSWEAAQEILPLVYSLSFSPDNAQVLEPKQPGTYLETGDGLWYSLDDAEDAHVSRKQVKMIERFFTQFPEVGG